MKNRMAIVWLAFFLIALISNICAAENPQATMKLKELINYKVLMTDPVHEINSLVEQGADINIAGPDGMTMLALASSHGRIKVVRMLLEKGADVNKADNQGMTPLIRASMHSQNEVIKLLVEKGAQVNKADYSGMTPLFSACSNGNLEIVKLFLSKGAQVNKVGRIGIYSTTPLEYACTGNNLEIVKLLLASGAQVTDKALKTAKLNGQNEIAALLKSRGAEDVATGKELKIEALDFAHPPDAKQLMSRITEIKGTALVQLGFKKVSEKEYRAAFSAPDSIAGGQGKITMMEAVSLFLIKAGHSAVPGDTETLQLNGDRFFTTLEHAEGAAPSFYAMGKHGMGKQIAPSTGAPGVPNKKKYRSSDIDYDLIHYYGNGDTRCELMARKGTQEGKQALITAITKNGVTYIRIRDKK